MEKHIIAKAATEESVAVPNNNLYQKWLQAALKYIFYSISFSLTGWNKRVDYEPGTGSKQLFPKMHLETCGGPLSSVRTTVELQTNHIGKGCDRETYSEKSLQKLCGWSKILLFCRIWSSILVLL